MSNNTLLNALVALLEDRPEGAREMLRSPEMNASPSAIMARLESAIEARERKAKIEVLKQVLQKTLRLDPPSENKEDFLWGVDIVETIIDDLILALES